MWHGYHGMSRLTTPKEYRAVVYVFTHSRILGIKNTYLYDIGLVLRVRNPLIWKKTRILEFTLQYNIVCIIVPSQITILTNTRMGGTEAEGRFLEGTIQPIWYPFGYHVTRQTSVLTSYMRVTIKCNYFRTAFCLSLSPVPTVLVVIGGISSI